MFSVINQLRANWLKMRLPCVWGMESREGIKEQDRCAFFLYGFFQEISLRAFHGFRVHERVPNGF